MRLHSLSSRAASGALSSRLSWLPEGYCEHAPPAPVAHAVECVWTSLSRRAEQVAVDPDGCVDLLIRCSTGVCAASSIPSVSIVGAMTRSEMVAVRAGDVHIGVRFHPGYASSLLRAPLNQCTDRVRPLHDVAHLHAESLIDAVARIEHLDALAAVLSTLIVPSPRDPDAMQRAIDALVQSHGHLPLNACSDLAHLGERQFRRACLARTGLSPKRLSRVLRYRQLAATLRAAPSSSMSVLAATYGYSDQAHMIRDVQQLCGRTPAALVREAHA
jgi:AraC-like DNA-binding protein